MGLVALDGVGRGGAWHREVDGTVEGYRTGKEVVMESATRAALTCDWVQKGQRGEDWNYQCLQKR